MCLSVSYTQTLWKVMHNYHQIKLWHDSYDSKCARMEVGEDGASRADITFNRNYVRQKLEHGLIRVWRVSWSTSLFVRNTPNYPLYHAVECNKSSCICWCGITTVRLWYYTVEACVARHTSHQDFLCFTLAEG